MQFCYQNDEHLYNTFIILYSVTYVASPTGACREYIASITQPLSRELCHQSEPRPGENFKFVTKLPGLFPVKWVLKLLALNRLRHCRSRIYIPLAINYHLCYYYEGRPQVFFQTRY